MDRDFHKKYNEKAGIYQIRNIINNKVYIGSAKNLYDRRARHWYDFRKGHYNLKLRRAFNKYGIDAFVFEIIELIEDISLLLVREQHYLDTLRPFENGYNILAFAGSCLGSKSSDLTREKLRIAHLGKKMPEKQRLELIEIRTGWKLTQNTKDKIGLANRNKGNKKVAQLDRNGNIVKSFTSINEAQKETGINPSNIGEVCNGNRKSAGGYYWKFI